MADVYPYDRTTRERVALLLYRALPLFYRVQDQELVQTGRPGDLEAFLKVLAAPLAVLRQSIDELHANLFIDTCGDAALPLLAEIIGTDLVFPDADTNRRDLRGTVSRRQRKGTRPMLQELGRDLTEQVIALVEGWRRLAVVQDLNIQRPDRPLPDVRPLTFGSSASGPLDAAQHLVDIRTISATTGRYHPRHLTHWVSVTRMFPLRDGTPAYTPDPDDPAPDPVQPQTLTAEWRYAFDPAGSPWALRQRPANDDDPVTTDRILADHFAARPGDFFGREGRFEIRVAGLPAAVAAPATEPRDPQPLLADLEIARGAPTIELLERPLHGWQNGQFRLTLCVVQPDTSNIPLTGGSIDERATILLGAGPSSASSTPTVSDTGVVLLRLTTDDGEGGFFPGATVAVSGSRPRARRAAEGGIGTLGFLRGALAVTLPPTWVFGARWLYLTADGSVYDAQINGEGAADIGFLTDIGPREADPAFFRVLGPGAAWPPLPRSTSLSKLTTMPPPPGRGPNVLHGGRVLDSTGADVASGTECALVFAGRFFDAGFQHELIGRLTWTGPDPAGARWELLTTVTVGTEPEAEVVTTQSGLETRLAELVEFRNAGPNQLVIAARFECSVVDAVFTPAEVVWSSDDGDTVLIYLPERTANNDASDAWPRTLANVSLVALASEDGSTRDGTGSPLRVAEGRVAPLRSSALHLRRHVKWRQIPQTPAPPPNVPPADLAFITDPDALALAQRCLDVDVEGGRFSLYGEAPQAWPLGPLDVPAGFVRPPNVTVAFEEAYTAHVGALPSPREIQLFQLTPTPVETPFPTRIVARSGVLSTSRDPEIYGRSDPAVAGVPRYTSVSAALAAIAADPSATEVVRIEDDATYPGEALTWPTGVDSLTILSADSRRPVLELIPAPAPAPTLHYAKLTLRGIAFGGTSVVFPESDGIEIQFCTVTDAQSTIVAPISGGGTCSVLRSITAGLSVVGGLLEVRDSVVDAGVDTGLAAIVSTGPRVELIGSTIVGPTMVPILEASHSIFTDVVMVEDRFHGCVRFSAVAAGSILPRRHEVVEGLDPRFLSLSRHHAGHVRLTEQSPAEISAGGEDGSELGAFGHLKAAQRLEGYQRRLTESTPAGLVWALLRVD